MSPPPTARGARSRDPEPSEPHGPGPRVNTCSSSCLSWLHPLRSWSLRQTRGGSLRHLALLFCKSCCNCIGCNCSRNFISSLGIQIQRVLFVEVLQLLLSWVRSSDIEMTVLWKIIIRVSAAPLASAYKLLVALSCQRGTLIFLDA